MTNKTPNSILQRWHLKRPSTAHGFTLLELLVAMVLMVIAFSIAFQAFSGTVHGLKRGMEVADGIKHGDFALGHVTSALNSTIFFHNNRKSYAFLIEKNSADGLPADFISFVTSSGAFMPHNSPFVKGPHRLNLFIDDEDGGSALYATAMPATANYEELEEEYEVEPILISKSVQGLEILIWDSENEDWTEEWEKDNSVPERILITLYVVSEDENEDPIEFSRVLEIPVADSLSAKLTSPTS